MKKIYKTGIAVLALFIAAVIMAASVDEMAKEKDKKKEPKRVEIDTFGYVMNESKFNELMAVYYNGTNEDELRFMASAFARNGSIIVDEVEPCRFNSEGKAISSSYMDKDDRINCQDLEQSEEKAKKDILDVLNKTKEGKIKDKIKSEEK